MAPAGTRPTPGRTGLPLSIPAGTVSSDVADAVVMVRLTSATLAANAQADGSDLRFTAADGTTSLAHEIEAFDAGSGTLTAWVRVPNVAAASPTGLYLYTGAGNAPDQSDPRATLSGFAAVWHMAADIDGGAAGLDDSGPDQLDGIALADAAELTAASGPAVALDGSLDRLEGAPLRLSDDGFTVAAWVRADTLSGERVLATQGDPATGGAFELRLDATGPPTLVAALRTAAGVVEARGGVPVASTWHAVVATWDQTTLRLYLDGTEVASAAASDLLVDGPRPVTIGADPSGSRALAGAVGELWIDDEAWTPARIGLFHANLDDPAGTVTVGVESSGTWFGQGSWTIRRPVGISDALTSVTLTDFPLLVHVTDSGLAARAADRRTGLRVHRRRRRHPARPSDRVVERRHR